MKAFVVLLIALSSVVAQAGLKSYTGKVTKNGFNYSCSFTNNTDNTLDMKYVVFSLEGVSYDRPVTYSSVRIDERVRSGESIKHTMNVSVRQTATFCTYQAR